MADLLDFTGKSVVITGGSTGIGLAAAQAFAQQGALVAIGGRGATQGEAAVRSIRDAGGTALFVPTDVTIESDIENLVATAVREHGGFDVALNNAGLLPPTGLLLEQSLDDWNQTIAVDLTGVFLSMKHEIPVMLSAGGGAIINTTSVAGLIADPGMAPYAAAKHGVVGLTKAAALDYADRNIRVNAVAPGVVRTAMIDDWLADPEMRDTVLNISPQRRAAEPRELVGAILYLASPLASFTTGAVYAVDGGQTAH